MHEAGLVSDFVGGLAGVVDSPEYAGGQFAQTPLICEVVCYFSDEFLDDSPAGSFGVAEWDKLYL